MKKIQLSFFLLLACNVNLLAQQTSGSCGANGSNLTWTYSTQTHEIRITGTGAMTDYGYHEPGVAPWSSYDIRSAVIEEGVTSIGNCAFYKQSNLSSISLPSTLETIGNDAFGCAESYNLTTVQIPSSVTNIGREAFLQCYGLNTIIGGENVERIGVRAFKETALTEAMSFSSVKKIDEQAFEGCHQLERIYFPNVQEIGLNAFNGCTSLYDMHFGEYLNYVDERAFYDCSALMDNNGRLQIDAATPPSVNYATAATDLFNIDETYLATRVILYVPSGSVQAYSQHDVWGKLIVRARDNSGVAELKAGTDYRINSGVIDFDTPTHCVLTDMTGRTIYSGTTTRVATAVPAGIYVLRTDKGASKVVL